MIKALLYTASGEFREDVQPEEISDLLTVEGNLLWIDVAAPTGSEMALLRKEFGFHELAVEDAVKRHQRPKIDHYDNFYFVVFYTLSIESRHDSILLRELDLFLGRNYLVTVHNGDVREIEETVARWRRNTETIGHNIGVLIYSLLDGIVDDYFKIVDYLSERVDTIEQQMFGEFDEQALQGIFSLKKQLQSVRRVVAPERDVVWVLSRGDITIFPRETAVYFQDILDHILRVTDSIDTYRDLLSNALEVYLTSVSNRLNQVMKTLTAITTIMMTDALIAGIYGMNFRAMPEIEWAFGYLWALGLMIVVSLSLASFFRHKKWI